MNLTLGLTIISLAFTANAKTLSENDQNLTGFKNAGKSSFTIKSIANANFNRSGKSKHNQTFFLKNGSVSAYSTESALLQKDKVTTNSLSFEYQTKSIEKGVLGLEVYHEGNWKEIWKIDAAKQSLNNSDWNSQVINFEFYPGETDIRFFASTSGEDDTGGVSLSSINFSSLATSTEIEYEYDELGRLVCAKDSINGERNFEYDKAGNRQNVSIGSCN